MFRKELALFIAVLFIFTGFVSALNVTLIKESTPLNRGNTFYVGGTDIVSLVPSIDSPLPMENHNADNIKCATDLQTIIWNNGAPTDDWVLLLSQLDEVFPFNGQVADDFIFEDCDKDVIGVRWWGNFWGVGEPIDPVDFNIYFYEDNGNVPTGSGMENPEYTVLKSYFIQDVSGINDSGQRFYSVNLPTPFIALQGEKYWLVVQAVFEFPPKWGRVTNDGTVYLNPSVFGCPLLGDPFWTNHEYGDMAWYLTGGINNPPSAPTINGSNSGKPNIPYDFTFNSIDSDGDDVRYIINWGDNTSNTTDFNASYSNVTVSHTWINKGTYIISAKAQDEYGAESGWATFEVTISRNKALFKTKPILVWLFEKFPILRYLLGL